jgi:hypothetical protein
MPEVALRPSTPADDAGDNAAALRIYEALGFTERVEHPDARLHELRAQLTAAA